MVNVTVDVPISVGGRSVTTSWMAGELLRPTAGQPDVLVVMIPGATETSRYFEVTVKPEQHNSALALRRAGYSTLTLDRLGTRDSGHPPSRQVDTVTQARAVQAVVAAARNGDFGFTPSKIVAYGHSIGSMIAIAVEARRPTWDAMVLTGYAHAPAAEPIVAALYAGFVPANESPELPNDGWDDGYLTSAPATELETVPDDVAAYARQVMQVVSHSEANAVDLTVASRITECIEVPVLVAVGGEDAIFCGPLAPGNDCSSAASLAATELPLFPRSPDARVTVIPGAGHEVQLDSAAPRLAAEVAAFLRDVL